MTKRFWAIWTQLLSLVKINYMCCPPTIVCMHIPKTLNISKYGIDCPPNIYDLKH